MQRRFTSKTLFPNSSTPVHTPWGCGSLANLHHSCKKLGHTKAFLVILKLSQYGNHRKDILFVQTLLCCRVPFSKIR